MTEGREAYDPDWDAVGAAMRDAKAVETARYLKRKRDGWSPRDLAHADWPWPDWTDNRLRDAIGHVGRILIGEGQGIDGVIAKKESREN